MIPAEARMTGEWIGLAVVALFLGGCARLPTAPQTDRAGTPSLRPALALSSPRETKLIPSGGIPHALFGYSVALSGDLALIGSEGEEEGDKEISSGVSYVFRRSGGAWAQEAVIATPGAEESEDFNISVAVDGDVAVISSQADEEKGSFAGAALVFRRSGGLWEQEAKLTASDGSPDDFLGSSVAIDGNVIVVGAEGDDDKGNASGSAYVFRRTGGIWREEAKLVASDGRDFQDLGIRVALSGDVALIGARGAAYVFRRSAGVWMEEATLVTPESGPAPPAIREVGLSGDVAVVSVPNDGGNGLAYVFRHDAGVWTHEATLMAEAGANPDRVLSIAVRGNLVILGTPLDEDGNKTGSVLVFAGSQGIWTRQAKLLPSDGERFGLFGWSVSTSRGRVLVGAIFDGAAYVYDLRPVRVVSIDVMPGSERNPINPGRGGTVPVVILSDANVDAPADMDRASLTFGAGGDEPSLQARGNGTPNCGVLDVNGDGLDDLLCHFLTEVAGFSAQDTEAVLRGAFLDGTPIEGRDTFTPVGRVMRLGQLER